MALLMSLILGVCVFTVSWPSTTGQTRSQQTVSNTINYGSSRVHSSASSQVHFPTSATSSGNQQSRDRLGVAPASHAWSSQNRNRSPNDNFLALKIKVKDMTKAEDFFAALGASAPLESVEDGGRERRPARASFSDQAGCEPENVTVDLAQYTHTVDDPSVAVFPRCVRVPRCGGCCYPNNLFECLPTKTSFKKITRGLVRLNSALLDSSGRRRREAAVMETIDLEVHEACKCQCKVMAHDCDDEKHIYRPELCQCMCVNTQDQSDCVSRGHSHIWDTTDCSCRCRERRRCSTGLVFSDSECECVLPDSK